MKHVYYLCGVFLLVLLYGCNSNEQKVKRSYYEDGVLESEIGSLDGVLHGEAKYYYPNGKLKELIPFRYGKIHGEFYNYTKNGVLRFKKIIVNDTLHGRSVDYFENGQTSIITDYVHGVVAFNIGFYPNGDTLSFYENGRALRFFKDGMIEQITCSQSHDISSVRSIRFSPDGNIIQREEPLICLTRRDSMLLDEQYPKWRVAQLSSSAK